MSRFRKVDTRIWNDAKFRDLSDGGKLVFFMLLTHPGMTALGAMRATLPGLAAEMGWQSDAFRKAFAEGSSKGLVEHDERACLVSLPNFLKYNRPESPNVVKAWTSAMDMLPECVLKSRVVARAHACTEAMTEGFTQAFREAFGKGMPNQEPEPEQEQEQEPEEEQASLRSASSSAVPNDTTPIDLESRKAQRIASITDDAIEAYNRILAAGGLLPSVRAAVGREKRQTQVKRCQRQASEICRDQFEASAITAKFWEAYFSSCAADPFLSGRGPYSGDHANWRPDFEYLTRPSVMLKVFDRATSVAAR